MRLLPLVIVKRAVEKNSRSYAWKHAYSEWHETLFTQRKAAFEADIVRKRKDRK
jgi:hypothetical protein